MAKVPRLAAILVATLVLAGTCLQLVACGAGERTTPIRHSSTSASTQTPDSRRPWSFHGQRGITAAFTPTNLALYRSLLPAPFGMPQSPLVVVAVVYYNDVASPLVPYHEGYVFSSASIRDRTAGTCSRCRWTTRRQTPADAPSASRSTSPTRSTWRRRTAAGPAT